MSPRKFARHIWAALASAGASAILLAGALTFISWPFSEAAATDVPTPRLSAASGPVAKGSAASQPPVAPAHQPKKLTITAKPKVAKSRPARQARSQVRRTAGKKVSGSGWKTARASWYGPGFYGHTMAGGGRLTRNSMVVAHRSLPFGTRVEIRYNGKTVVAVVKDRGPFVGGRQFDLGPGTARSLGFSGVGTISYRLLGRG